MLPDSFSLHHIHSKLRSTIHSSSINTYRTYFLRLSQTTATMCTVYDEYATCGKHKCAANVKYEKCKTQLSGRECQTLKRKKIIGTFPCNHGSKGRSCVIQ